MTAFSVAPGTQGKITSGVANEALPNEYIADIFESATGSDPRQDRAPGSGF